MRKRRLEMPPASKKNFVRGILCGVVGLLCFLNIKFMYPMAIIFFACSAANFWLFSRLKKREDEALEMKNKLLKGLEDEEKDETPQKRRMTGKERRDEYNAFLQDLEEELGDFDEDEFDEDE